MLPAFLLGSTAQFTLARFTATASVAGNSFTTAASWDTVAPTVSTSVIAKTGQYFAGFIKQSGAFYVYANATDAGSPASGVAAIRADVSTITSGQTAVLLVAGSYAVQGVTYGYRSAPLAAGIPLTAGSKSYSLTSTDNAGNTRVQTGYTVTVDNTAPSGSDIFASNGGAAAGTIEAGDTITYTFSEVIDPESILPGWTGGSSSVVIRFTDNASSDSFAVWDSTNTVQLNLGSVNTNGDYVAGPVTAGAAGTPSTMVLNTSTNTITITLGTVAGPVVNDAKKHRAAWTPSGAAFDRAGNAMASTTVTGANVVAF
jgi:hypothetical protein